jgi:glycosyltransferase involved in cell wall biosynthesis
MSDLEPRRELPAFETLVLKPRGQRFALVIPVINEGERIRQQLTRIAEVAPQADVVIADGGSTDGSLDAAFLRQVGVRALLTKRGPGRLGAQLRMAYAWCLDEGYDGIITVDGNGKDGVEAIDRFVALLDQGFGYIQGSRYQPGGEAINTPFDRKIAGRLIHAPLLSLAGRRWYTDTTNGFRGYSSAYLRDPRVNPFRDVFGDYALLFYLTVRAGQLGYRTCEIPVSRRYPPQGKTPTKISGFRGRFDMFKELIDTVRGVHNPSR